MIRWLTALLFSVLLHTMILYGVYGVVSRSSAKATLPEFDLSSVEMSFSETPNESAPVQISSPLASMSRPIAVRPPELLPVKPIQAEGIKIAPTFTLSPFQPKVPAVALPERSEKLEVTQAQQSVATTPPTIESAPAPIQARVDVPSKLRQTLRPQYPEAARRRGAEGNVTLDLSITAEGKVDAVKVVVSSKDVDLDAAAVKAVRRARFTPARKDGHCVASHAAITLSFRLRN